MSEMMNTKLMSDSVFILKCILVSKIMNIRLLSDSGSIANAYRCVQADFRLYSPSEMHSDLYKLI